MGTSQSSSTDSSAGKGSCCNNLKEDCKNLFKSCYGSAFSKKDKEDKDDAPNDAALTEVELSPTDTTNREREQLEQELRDKYIQELVSKDDAISSLQNKLLVSEQNYLQLQRTQDAMEQYDFFVPNYKQLRAERKEFSSHPMYTYPGGYKFKIDVHMNGIRTGASSHLSFQVWSQDGQYDEELTFPVKYVIHIQLMNQYGRDDGHHQKQIHCVCKEKVHGSFVASDFKFIPLTELRRDDGKQTEYLKDDSLWFRITKITVG